MTSLQTSWPRPSIQTLEGAKSHGEELGLSEGCTKWRLIGRYFKRSRIAGKHGYKHDMMKKLKTQEGKSIEGKIHYFTKVRYLFAWESSSNLREFTRAPSSDFFIAYDFRLWTSHKASLFCHQSKPIRWLFSTRVQWSFLIVLIKFIHRPPFGVSKRGVIKESW